MFKFKMEESNYERLLLNGSAHAKGCTYTALNEVAETLNKEAGNKASINLPEIEKTTFTNFIG